jgi:hypothetical protein
MPAPIGAGADVNDRAVPGNTPVHTCNAPGHRFR